jgi:hypothetical protein
MSILCALALPSALFAADDLPKAFDFIRYDSILKKSPFAVASAVAPVATAASFAKDLYIANAAHSPDGDLVTIASSTDKNFKKYLTTKEPVEGYSISNIEWSEKVGETKVTIAKDGQFATLTFNQALLSQPVANAPPPNLGNPALMQQPQQPLQQQQAQQPGVIPPRPAQPLTGQPTPVTHSRGMIQRNPRAVQTPDPATQPQIEN